MTAAYAGLIDLLQKLAASGTEEKRRFGAAADGVVAYVRLLDSSALPELLLEIGVIPEWIGHNSSEEKLYAKASDIVLAEALSSLGLSAEVIAARAGVADVAASSPDHGYSLVADAKVFRLSRTAKNQKDFKVEAMDGWRGDADFALLVCPEYQYPAARSAIYEQAIRRGVTLLSFEQLSLLLRFGVSESVDSTFSSLFSVPHELREMVTVEKATDATVYWAAVEQSLGTLLGANLSSSPFSEAREEMHLFLKARAGEEADYWRSKISEFAGLSHEEAVERLIVATGARKKLLTIEQYLT